MLINFMVLSFLWVLLMIYCTNGLDEKELLEKKRIAGLVANYMESNHALREKTVKFMLFGKQSSGKSSWISAYFKKLFGGNIKEGAGTRCLVIYVCTTIPPESPESDSYYFGVDQDNLERVTEEDLWEKLKTHMETIEKDEPIGFSDQPVYVKINSKDIITSCIVVDPMGFVPPAIGGAQDSIKTQQNKVIMEILKNYLKANENVIPIGLVEFKKWEDMDEEIKTMKEIFPKNSRQAEIVVTHVDKANQEEGSTIEALEENILNIFPSSRVSFVSLRPDLLNKAVTNSKVGVDTMANKSKEDFLKDRKKDLENFEKWEDENYPKFYEDKKFQNKEYTKKFGMKAFRSIVDNYLIEGLKNYQDIAEKALNEDYHSIVEEFTILSKSDNYENILSEVKKIVAETADNLKKESNGDTTNPDMAHTLVEDRDIFLMKSRTKNLGFVTDDIISAVNSTHSLGIKMDLKLSGNLKAYRIIEMLQFYLVKGKNDWTEYTTDQIISFSQGLNRDGKVHIDISVGIQKMIKEYFREFNILIEEACEWITFLYLDKFDYVASKTRHDPQFSQFVATYANVMDYTIQLMGLYYRRFFLELNAQMEKTVDLILKDFFNTLDLSLMNSILRLIGASEIDKVQYILQEHITDYSDRMVDSTDNKDEGITEKVLGAISSTISTVSPVIGSLTENLFSSQTNEKGEKIAYSLFDVIVSLSRGQPEDFPCPESLNIMSFGNHISRIQAKRDDINTFAIAYAKITFGLMTIILKTIMTNTLLYPALQLDRKISDMMENSISDFRKDDYALLKKLLSNKNKIEALKRINEKIKQLLLFKPLFKDQRIVRKLEKYSLDSSQLVQDLENKNGDDSVVDDLLDSKLDDEAKQSTPKATNTNSCPANDLDLNYYIEEKRRMHDENKILNNRIKELEDIIKKLKDKSKNTSKVDEKIELENDHTGLKNAKDNHSATPEPTEATTSQTTSEQTAANQGPENTKKPDQTKAEQTKADQTKAEQAKPEQTKPDQTKAEQAKPEQTKPDQTKAEQAKPEQTKPEQAKAEQAKPEQTKPEQAKAEQAKPEQAKPEQAKPEQAKPEQAKPEQAKPEQAKPEEAKPEEAKPEETQANKATASQTISGQTAANQVPENATKQDQTKPEQTQGDPTKQDV